MLLCFVVKNVIWYKNTTAATNSLRISANNNSLKHPSPQSRQSSKWQYRPYHFCAKNEYIDGQFLGGGCGGRQGQVPDGADVVFTDTRHRAEF